MTENKKKFAMPLIWRNCETCPPEEFENKFLFVTDGELVYCASWHKTKGWTIPFDEFEDEALEPDKLKYWYWADILQTVKEYVGFRQVN